MIKNVVVNDIIKLKLCIIKGFIKVNIINTNKRMSIVFMFNLNVLLIPNRKNNSDDLSIEGLKSVINENRRRKRKTVM